MLAPATKSASPGVIERAGRLVLHRRQLIEGGLVHLQEDFGDLGALGLIGKLS